MSTTTLGTIACRRAQRLSSAKTMALHPTRRCRTNHSSVATAVRAWAGKTGISGELSRGIAATTIGSIGNPRSPSRTKNAQHDRNLLLPPPSSFRNLSSSSSEPDTTTDETETTTTTPLGFGVVDVNYVSPLGDLITRLKMVSITGCVLSVAVLPGLVFLKNGELPNAQQITMGGIATLGATGSTAALHFVFGSYVLEMKTVRNAPSDEHDENNENDENDENNSDSNSNQRLVLEASTRSVFGFWKNTYVFDPTRDVSSYKGNRPFANFSILDGIPLYVHPEKLDAVTRHYLLRGGTGGSAPTKEQAETRDAEGLVAPNATSKQKKPKNNDDDDDEFF